MTVYVDDVQHRYGSMIMCHLWADTHEELLAFVDKIGVNRRWLQQPPKASWVHFDICLSKKKLALSLGAILTDKYGPVEHTAKLDIASGEPRRVQRGRGRLEGVAKCRGMFKRDGKGLPSSAG
jgi:hypothetical protein